MAGTMTPNLLRLLREATNLVERDAVGYPWIQYRQRKDLEDAVRSASTEKEKERILRGWIRTFKETEST